MIRPERVAEIICTIFEAFAIVLFITGVAAVALGCTP